MIRLHHNLNACTVSESLGTPIIQKLMKVVIQRGQWYSRWLSKEISGVKGQWSQIKVFVQVAQLRARQLTLRRQQVSSGSEGDAEQELDQGKVQAALQTLRDAQKAAEAGAAAEEKGKYHSLRSDGETVTAEQMEAYRLNKERIADPLADMKTATAAGGDYSLV
jgi:hypothetical protein